MNRRRFLALSGTVAGAAVAGCTGGDGGSGDNDGNESDESADGTDASTDGSDGGDGSGTDAETDDTGSESDGDDWDQLAAGDPDVQFGDPTHHEVEERVGDGVEHYVTVTVENVGDGASGSIAVYVDWLDDDGEPVSERTHTEQVTTLEPGQTWDARVDPTWVDDTEQIADVEVDWDVGRGVRGGPPQRPAGVSLTESELDESSSWSITGTMANERSEPLASVLAYGRWLDADGTLLGDGYDEAEDLPAGEDWSFDVSVQTERHDAIADHEVIFDDRS